MGSKDLLVIVMLLATILLISAEVSSLENDHKLDKNDGNHTSNGLEESKYPGFGSGPYGGQYGGGFRRGGGYCRYGCCGWRDFYGRCRRCCNYPGEHLDIDINAEPHN
ncbi:hypothetical protein Lal_00017724 [Lupinus albus]|uniref:Putative glycine rich protein n=1 Tax=Lupinus albus TaxID=3870 RepID=A0A6A5MDK1_LUPAL|nr:putative glycine rich protein [Lupinus albus]KAF1870143.1 hypothetical protein Lal_00017724 [Lupinus albus]